MLRNMHYSSLLATCFSCLILTVVAAPVNTANVAPAQADSIFYIAINPERPGIVNLYRGTPLEPDAFLKELGRIQFTDDHVTDYADLERQLISQPGVAEFQASADTGPMVFVDPKNGRLVVAKLVTNLAPDLSILSPRQKDSLRALGNIKRAAKHPGRVFRLKYQNGELTPEQLALADEALFKLNGLRTDLPSELSSEPGRKVILTDRRKSFITMDASIEELLRREGKRVNNLSADSPVEDAPGTIPSGDTSSGATPNTKVASTEGDLAHVKLTEMPGSQLGGVTGPASAVEKSEISPEAI